MFGTLLLEDVKIREFIETKLFRQISKVEIERIQNVKEQKFDQIKIFIHTHKPAIILGENGKNIEALSKQVSRMTDSKVSIDIVNIKNPDMDAKIVADSICAQIENRASFRRAQKFAIRNARRAGAKGIKTLCSGRLGGVEMARSEGYSEGNVPLQTLRADIDYALSEADTTYGKLGVKV